jgi:hypothetical protein
VFVSFSSKNQKACQEIQRRLARGGIEAWTYPGNIAPTEEFPAVITRQIKQSDVLLLLLSTDANQSLHVRREVHLATELPRRIVVFRLDNCTLHDALDYDLSGVQQVNSPTKNWSQETDALVAAVRSALALPPLRPRFPWLRSAWLSGLRVIASTWNFIRMFALALLALLIVGGVLLWQQGVVGKFFSWFAPHLVPTSVELTADPDASHEGTAVVFRAVVRADDETTAQGAVEFRAGNRMKKVPVVDGQAEWPLEDLVAGQYNISATFIPSGRFGRSSAQVFHHRTALPPPVPPDPNRHGVVEVTAGGVRALAVSLAKVGERRLCDRASKTEMPDPGREFKFDPKTGKFTDDSLRQIVEAVQARARWLATQGVPRHNVHVVVGSGIQGWSKNADRGRQVEDRLRQSEGLDHVELTQPWEEAGCLAVQVVGKDAKGKALVLAVGGDTIKAALTDPADAFPNPLEALHIPILGTRSLDRWVRENVGPRPAGLRTDREQRKAYAEQLARACRKTIIPDLKHEEVPLGGYAWPDVYVVGEDTWAVCRIAQPNSPPGGRLRLEKKSELEQLLNGFDRAASDENLKDAEIPLEQLLSAAEILRAMSKHIDLGGHQTLTFVDGSRYDWLFVYLERRLNDRPAPP